MDPAAAERLQWEGSFAFQGAQLELSPAVASFSDIDGHQVNNPARRQALGAFLEGMATGEPAPDGDRLFVGFEHTPDGVIDLPSPAPGVGAPAWGSLQYRDAPGPRRYSELAAAWDIDACTWVATPDLTDGTTWALGDGHIDASLDGVMLDGTLEASLLDAGDEDGSITATFAATRPSSIAAAAASDP